MITQHQQALPEVIIKLKSVSCDYGYTFGVLATRTLDVQYDVAHANWTELRLGDYIAIFSGPFLR